ncbi:3'-5' exonuclease [Mahella australiensis]|uniref:DNA polymerase III, epsilon subunit n=1 Tax=Mahella australiensis (strain DSM 15567 / CIP 107919 / 50-1 BON) TaxID=697281 RepID=F4A0X9_MAHA5|nr:exonuclease domain-containing protein [Mahella australiensis]AEE98056.1 DNA polymerase III, epsilon subunit [Mahella australiensis 50-1 BON]
MNILKHIPGFRSGAWWKKLIAAVYYLFSLLILIPSIETGLALLILPFIIFGLIDKIKAGQISNNEAAPEVKQTNKQKTTVKLNVTIEGPKQQPAPAPVLNTQSVNHRININTKKWLNTCNEFVAIDLETTGLNPAIDKIVEIAAVKFKYGEIIDSYTTLINPGIHIPSSASKINHITDETVHGAPDLSEVLPNLLNFIGDSILVMHNASFDLKFLKYHAAKLGYDISNPFIDTLPTCKKLFTDFENYQLATVANYLKISTADTFHRACNDAEICGPVLIKCIDTAKNESSQGAGLI